MYGIEEIIFCRSRYHVYVAAALMEYYCSKDKNIAFRIFELGLKKFSHSPEYVLCYIDYLSHLNGTNYAFIQCGFYFDSYKSLVV